MLVILLLVVSRVLFFENELKSENRIFTIGIVKDLTYGKNRHAVYEYYYGGVKYEQKGGYGEKIPQINSCYLVVFSTKNKSFSRLIHTAEVDKKYFKTYETEYWISSPPFGIEESEIEKEICGKCLFSL